MQRWIIMYWWNARNLLFGLIWIPHVRKIEDHNMLHATPQRFIHQPWQIAEYERGRVQKRLVEHRECIYHIFLWINSLHSSRRLAMLVLVQQLDSLRGDWEGRTGGWMLCRQMRRASPDKGLRPRLLSLGCKCGF